MRSSRSALERAMARTLDAFARRAAAGGGSEKSGIGDGVVVLSQSRGGAPERVGQRETVARIGDERRGRARKVGERRREKEKRRRQSVDEWQEEERNVRGAIDAERTHRDGRVLTRDEQKRDLDLTRVATPKTRC